MASSALPHPRPRVLVNFASSLDGKINPAPAQRPARFMMSRDREDFRRMVALRSRADAVVIGAANLRLDNPDLSIPPDERAARRARGEAEPMRIVVTSAGTGLTPDMRMFDPARGGPSVIAHGARLPNDTRARFAPLAELVEFAGDAVPIDALLAWLVGRGVRTLLCEGGGDLCAQFFAASAVDEVYLTLVPRVLGGKQAPTMVGGSGFPPDAIPAPKLASLERVGDELFLRYEFVWP